MPNNIPVTPGVGSAIATDQAGDASHVELQKLCVSADGDRTKIPATAAQGLTVDVTRVQTAVPVITTGGVKLAVDGSSVTQPVTNAPGQTVAVSAPVAAPVSVRLSNGAGNVDTIPVSFPAAQPVTGSIAVSNVPAVSQSGGWDIGTVATITNPVTVAGAVSISGVPAVTGSVTANQGNGGSAAQAWTHKVTDGTKIVGVTTDGGDNGLNVHVLNGGGGAAQQDKTAFVEGTGQVNPIGGVFNDAFAGDPAAGNASVVRITGKRAVHVNPRKSDGTEIGTAAAPIRTDPTGTTAQPVAGTVTANQGGAPWSQNLTQVSGVAIATAAAGIAKVGVTDSAGAVISQANPLQVTLAPSGNFWKAAVTYGASATDQPIYTPPGGKTVYVEGMIITPTAAGAILKIYDHTNAAANMLFQAQPGTATIVITYTRPVPLSAVNNILRYTTGLLAAGDITAWGFYA